MENVNLFLLRLLLASLVMSLVTARKENSQGEKENSQGEKENSQGEKYTKIVHNSEPLSAIETAHKHHEFYLKPKLEPTKYIPKNKRRKDGKISNKSKRETYGKYGKYASARSSNFGYGEYSNNLPLYLVFNRKVGAYYPFYKYPKENHVRRNSNVRRVPQQ